MLPGNVFASLGVMAVRLGCNRSVEADPTLQLGILRLDAFRAAVFLPALSKCNIAAPVDFQYWALFSSAHVRCWSIALQNDFDARDRRTVIQLV